MTVTLKLTKAQAEATLYALDLYTDDTDGESRMKRTARRAQAKVLRSLGRDVPPWIAKAEGPSI